MRAEEMSAHLGKYVFLVVEGDRSFPCDVLRVEAGEVLAVETDHDDWPLSLRRVPLDRVAYMFSADVVEKSLDQQDDLGRFWWAPKKWADFPCSPADFFNYLRAHLNDETLLARPKKNKKSKKGEAA